MQGYITAVLFFCFPGLSTVAKLIGCNINELTLTLSKRNMRVRNDTIVQKLTLPQVYAFNKIFLHFVGVLLDLK